jgi:hypothetical protein
MAAYLSGWRLKLLPLFVGLFAVLLYQAVDLNWYAQPLVFSLKCKPWMSKAPSRDQNGLFRHPRRVLCLQPDHNPRRTKQSLVIQFMTPKEAGMTRSWQTHSMRTPKPEPQSFTQKTLNSCCLTLPSSFNLAAQAF